jgi:hypothetical protein
MKEHGRKHRQRRITSSFREKLKNLHIEEYLKFKRFTAAPGTTGIED